MGAQIYRDLFPDIPYRISPCVAQTGEFFSFLFPFPNARDRIARRNFIENMQALTGLVPSDDNKSSNTIRFLVHENDAIHFSKEFRAFISVMKGPIDHEHGRLMMQTGYYGYPWRGLYRSRVEVHHGIHMAHSHYEKRLELRKFVVENVSSFYFCSYSVFYIGELDEADLVLLRFPLYDIKVKKSLNRLGRL